MTPDALKILLRGATMLGSWTVALFFLRYWRTSRDRLFGFFSLAFAVMGVNSAALALLRVDDERQYFLYVARLLAFGIILYAIWDKNRTKP
jgi:glucose uptake protein GlcU